ncbi:MAG TPA: alkaline phosphatase family protein [Actinomycetota bacterium]|nr:alkaline phosphatase family protein [Actinomycetota bacterium]
MPRTLWVFALLGGAVALVVTYLGSITLGIVAGVAVWLTAILLARWAARRQLLGGDHDPSRRRFLALAGLGGLAWVAGGAAIGRTIAKAVRPNAAASQETAAAGLGAEYMELVGRSFRAGRSGDIQLLMAPFNSSNYTNESLSLVPKDPRTSHASIWMYLERIPMLVYGPGIVEPSDSEGRVSLADLAPTTAQLIGFDGWPTGRDGRVLPGLRTTGKTPKVVVTFVYDGGGWNVLRHWPQDWPVLKRLMAGGANYRNALTGSFPAVTACAHATIGTGAFPRTHGITGHNIRADANGSRKAYLEPGNADPSTILVPTLADLYSDATDNAAWVGEIGYQIWHMGMIGYGGKNRPAGQKPVGVYWDEGSASWRPHNPELYRLPATVPGQDVYASHQAAFTAPDWDQEFTPQGGQANCCSPPVVQYQHDLIAATLDAEPIGQDGPSLLYITYKAPDYTGHIYNMYSKWEGLMLRSTDEQLGALVDHLEAKFPGEYVLIVTADHGQCPLPDAVDGVRLDLIQLQDVIEEQFGSGLGTAVQFMAPSEVYLNVKELRDSGATPDDVAAHLQHLTYRQNLGPYVPQNAVEQDLLDKEEFAAVFAATWLEHLGDPSRYGQTAYGGEETDPGIPPRSLIA